MRARNRIGALLAAGTLVMAFAAVASAGGGAPTYEISVDKVADPAEVPAAGGSVTYTISVTGEGTGFFQSVVVDDDMDGCTLSGPTGDQPSGGGAGKLEEGETWVYTCTVEGVLPGDENTATVFACNSGGGCDSESADADAEDSVTVGEADNGGGGGGGGGGGQTAGPTQADTDTAPSGAPAQPGTSGWLLLLVGGILIAGLVFTRPARVARDS